VFAQKDALFIEIWNLPIHW